MKQRLYRENEGKKPRYNGNLSAMAWKAGDNYLRRFDYEYNDMDWLKKAEFSYYESNGGHTKSPTLELVPYVGMDHEDYTSEYDYDKNGNIISVYRQGLVDAPESDRAYDTLDDFVVTYNGNQKIKVDGSGIGTPSYYGSSSFVDGADENVEYTYNSNGSITKDLNKGISKISYDPAGNLNEITFDDKNRIKYVYSTDGTRLRTIHTYTKSNHIYVDSIDYAGNLIYRNGRASMFMFPGGFCAINRAKAAGFHYYIQDYLGSNRMIVDRNGKVEQVNHYYPYGGVIGGIDLNPTAQQFKYEGKELDNTLGLDWYDIQARQYDPIVPSWNAVDPLCETSYYISPYAYCANNSINKVDKSGLDWIMAHYENNYFYYFDSRINCQEDIFDYYYSEIEKQNIRYVGKNVNIYEETKNDKRLLFNLLSDGRYKNSEYIYSCETEWDGAYGHLNIGTDIALKFNTLTNNDDKVNSISKCKFTKSF